MGNKLVWIVVVVLALLGLYYYSMPASEAPVESAPAAVAEVVPEAPADAVAPAPVQ
ncbi:MAG: hypothetical protein Q7S19_03125 [bacterium]|nr:hypothetical protein [bacterium]